MQVGTPGLIDRCRRLESKLDAAGLSKAIQPAFDPKLQALVDVPAAELARNLLNERCALHSLSALNFIVHLLWHEWPPSTLNLQYFFVFYFIEMFLPHDFIRDFHWCQYF